MANKTVMRLHMNDCYKCKKVALHSVTKIEGIDSLTINMKENTLTVIGDADPVCISNLLRKKFRCAQLVSVGPVPQAGGGGGEKEGKGGGGGGKGGGKGEEGEGKGGGDKGGGRGNKGEDKGKGKGGDKGGGGGAGAGAGAGTELMIAHCYPPFSGCSCRPYCYPVCQTQCCPPWSACSCRPECYRVCQGHCCPPCSTCSCRPEILWPKYPNPSANSDEVWYVWNEDKQDSCAIM